jgi:molybdopterin/thiamine biosynthesis adenylyltransferase
MLVINEADLAEMQHAAGSSEFETCAVGFATPVDGGAGGERYIVSSIRKVPSEAYVARSATHATLSPDLVVDVANQSRRENKRVVFLHTHVGANAPLTFSKVDDQGEQSLVEYLGRRSPGTHFSAVVTSSGIVARRLGTADMTTVLIVGLNRRSTSVVALDASSTYDRQVRAFGSAGQAILEEMSIAIVGLGGTGSVVAQQLAHLGVKNFVLVDPDHVERTNLNRLIGASQEDVGVTKVEVAESNVRSILGGATCVSAEGDVVDEIIATRLIGVDFIFCCTDSIASRAVINQIAYQYFVPCIDMGVSIGARNGKVEHITGRVQMLSPGLGCLMCGDLLDGEQIRREMLSEEQRVRDPYITGAREPQPAVVSINSTMSSLAISMFLSAVTELPGQVRMQLYDGIRGTVRPTIAAKGENCLVCSSAGALGKGHLWDLPVRRKG